MPIGNQHLTDIKEKHVDTVPGMAHFAGTGPAGTRCGGCTSYVYDEKSKRHKTCGKYNQLTGKMGKSFDSMTPSCRYFDARPNTPWLSQPSSKPKP